jgi:predicted XRE-type DNA-binding protein
MIKNDVQKDIRKMMIDAELTQAQVGEKIGLKKQSISAAVYRDTEQHLNATVVKMLEVLGYDIELKYVKRK